MKFYNFSRRTRTKKYTHVFHSCCLKNYEMKEAPKYKNYLHVSGDLGSTVVKVLSTNRKVAGSISGGVIGIFH